jgi:hypothetical protein
MSYDINVRGAYPGKPAYSCLLYVRRDQVSVATNQSYYAWAFYQVGGPNGSWDGDSRPWYVGIGAQSWSGSQNNDFRGTPNGGQRLVSSGFAGWFGHNSDGYLDLWCSFRHEFGDAWGTAQGGAMLYTDRIPQRPGPPGAVTFSMVTPTTARAYVPGASNDDGSPIDSYLLRISRNANPEAAPFTDYTPNFTTGVVNLVDLIPGATYYVIDYSHNAQGYTAGPVRSFKTLSGARVGLESEFQNSEVLVGKGGVYVTAGVYVGKDGTFVLAI